MAAEVYIAAADSSGKVWLTEEFSPKPAPVMTTEVIVTSGTTRFGGPGKPPRRIAQVAGSLLVPQLEIPVAYLDQTRVDALQALVASGEACEISTDGGSTRYLFQWAADGFRPEHWDWDSTRFKCVLKIIPLGLNT